MEEKINKLILLLEKNNRELEEINLKLYNLENNIQNKLTDIERRMF